MIAVDGSEGALRALRFAVSPSRENPPLDLLIVNASETANDQGLGSVYMRPGDDRLPLDEGTITRIRPAIEIVEAAGLAYRAAVIFGNPSIAIADFAEETACNAIATGTRGLGVLAGLILGSTANKVLHLSKLPLILVP